MLMTGSGTCTVALAMRVDFVEGELPHEPPTTQSAPSDVSSFGRLYFAAQAIADECVARERKPGWVAEGECNSFVLTRGC